MKMNMRGQSAVEYLLLLGIVAAVVMISFTQGGLLGRTQQTTNVYFNSVSRVIHGENPAPINGGWCDLSGQKLRPEMSNGTPQNPNPKQERCPASLPCGAKVLYRKCACPEPAFGGSHCMETQPQDAAVLCPDVPACPDCTNDICLAPEPVGCGIITSGFMSCSNKACTRGSECGSCPLPTPVNASICPGSDQKVPIGTSWTMVSGGRQGCVAGAKCQAYCDGQSSSAMNGAQNGCTIFQCTGSKPAGAVACPGSEAVGESSPWRSVYDRTACAHACEYYCGFGTSLQSDATGHSVCVPNQCVGQLPACATWCPNDNIDVPTANMVVSGVTSCSDVRKCEALITSCPEGTLNQNNQ